MDNTGLLYDRKIPYMTFSVYKDQLPWGYDHLLEDYRRTLLSIAKIEKEWAMECEAGEHETQRCEAREYEVDRTAGQTEEAVAESIGGVKDKPENKPENESDFEDGFKDEESVAEDVFTKNQLALMVYFAFESSPASGVCRTSVREVMKFFGYAPRQNNTVVVKSVKNELGEIVRRAGNPSFRDSLKITPLFEDNQEKFSTCIEYRVDGAGECDPANGDFVFIDSHTYAKIMKCAAEEKNIRASELIWVYLYLKSIMKYVEGKPSAREQTRTPKPGKNHKPGTGWGCWGDIRDIAGDLGISEFLLEKDLDALEKYDVVYRRQKGISRMHYFATQNTDAVWRDLRSRVYRRAGK